MYNRRDRRTALGSVPDGLERFIDRFGNGDRVGSLEEGGEFDESQRRVVEAGIAPSLSAGESTLARHADSGVEIHPIDTRINWCRFSRRRPGGA
ncbi:hypothetical protein OB955_12750 [Halobacteria archaeon AArc-m2/3/4]|uniref:Uncharacterized protein n=1 Tax=Natronoglomus mannanivorans TaxID=2979990 RepID=A0ABT2QFB3_9EURY|nr:hypothetical protein [Halobacteria archaeon AArc-m2/3/4]